MSAALSIVERSRRDELLARIKQLLKSFIDVGESLLEFRTDRLYRDQYATFDEFCEAECGIKRSYAHQIIASYQAVAAIRMSAIADILPTAESQARELTRLEEPDQQVAAWQAVVERVDGDARKVTAKLVREEVNRLLPDPDEEPFIAFDEIATVRDWLMKRRATWPENLRPAFAKQLRLIAADMESQDANDGRQGTGGTAPDHGEPIAG